MTEEEFKTGKKSSKKTGKMTALKDFRCQYDDKQVIINKGDDVSDLNLPEWLITNLTTEQVLKG